MLSTSTIRQSSTTVTLSPNFLVTVAPYLKTRSSSTRPESEAHRFRKMNALLGRNEKRLIRLEKNLDRMLQNGNEIRIDEITSVALSCSCLVLLLLLLFFAICRCGRESHHVCIGKSRSLASLPVAKADATTNNAMAEV